MVAVPEMVVGRRLTFEDYQALPDDQHYEIIDGVLHVSLRARPRHQIVANRVAHLLTGETEASGSGTVVPDADLIINERDAYVSPDIMYFASNRFAAVDPDGWIRIVPDLIVEVLSPSTGDYDRTTKKRLYAELGVPHYWIADLGRGTLTEYVLEANGEYRERLFGLGATFSPELFPSLGIDLARLFGQMPPSTER